MPINRGMRSRTSGRSPASIVVSPGTLSIVTGTFQLTAVVKDQTGTVMAGAQPDAWHTSDAGVVTVSSTGLVTFVAVGTANIAASLTTVSGTITSNTCAVTATTGTNFVRSDFSSGSIGPQFYDVFGQGRWDVIDDPTGSGRGKIARVRYITDGVIQFDDNEALLPTPPPFTRTAGQEVWFQGDFYLGSTARMDPSGNASVQRKLIRFGWDGTQPHQFTCVPTSFGPQLVIANRVNDTGSATLDFIDTNLFALANQTWYTIKMQLRVNSAIGTSDGIVRIWMNGLLVYDRTDLRWTDPVEWAPNNPALYVWNEWGFGDQADSNLALDEYRYWDNVSFANVEAAL